MKEAGNLEGILLTGLTKDGVDLMESYVDRTGDVQTASFCMLKVSRQITQKCLFLHSFTPNLLRMERAHEIWEWASIVWVVKMNSSSVSQTNNTHTDTQSKINQYTQVRQTEQTAFGTDLRSDCCAEIFSHSLKVSILHFAHFNFQLFCVKKFSSTFLDCSWRC